MSAYVFGDLRRAQVGGGVGVETVREPSREGWKNGRLRLTRSVQCF